MACKVWYDKAEADVRRKATEMSRLEELIRDLCPDGVEYKPISNVAVVGRGKRVVKSQLTKEGEYPVFQNSLTPLGYYFESNLPGQMAFVIGAGAAGEIGYSEVNFWAADDCYFFMNNDAVDNRFLYHVLLSQQQKIFSKVRKASIPRLSRSVIENLLIPVPPLEVQREIVRILDNFMELTAELAAELTARKQQYEYYRDQLLNARDECRHIKIIDMLSQPITDGPHITPSFVSEGVPFVSVDAVWDGKIHFEHMRGYISEEFNY